MHAAFPQQLADTLARYEQQHLLDWWTELDDGRRQKLVRQIEAVNFDQIKSLIDAGIPSSQTRDCDGTTAEARRAQTPSQLVRLPAGGAHDGRWVEAIATGRELLAAGKVGAILVAGGEGTRLGLDHAKGMFRIGPVSGAWLFQILAEQLLARSRQAGVSIPYYVMTSDVTHDETVAFFAAHRHFGLDPDDVYFFRQGNMPAVDPASGRILMAAKDEICLSPDGHGGLLQALNKAGLIEQMAQRGIEYLYYHQVDNPTAIVCDPAFLGLHVRASSELSTKVVHKRSASEKMGLVVEIDGTTRIIEYSNLPDELASSTDDQGELRFWAGNTAMHVFSRSLLERLVADDCSLPFHRAHKQVACIDATGRSIAPEAPNAWKFERFIFDALPKARGTLVLEADRAREFNPVKSRDGCDTPEAARAAMLAIHAQWLRDAGCRIAQGVEVEISPLFALDADELAAKVKPGTSFSRSVVL